WGLRERASSAARSEERPPASASGALPQQSLRAFLAARTLSAFTTWPKWCKSRALPTRSSIRNRSRRNRRHNPRNERDLVSAAAAEFAPHRFLRPLPPAHAGAA